MKKYKGECKKIEQDFVYTGKKHPTWLCNITKGSHVFELAFPDSVDFYRRAYDIKAETPEGWYPEYKQKVYDKSSNNSLGRIFGGIMFSYRCIHCKKQAWDTDHNPDKRIREHLNKKL
jgi:hypothetical protein